MYYREFNGSVLRWRPSFISQPIKMLHCISGVRSSVVGVPTSHRHVSLSLFKVSPRCYSKQRNPAHACLRFIVSTNDGEPWA